MVLVTCEWFSSRAAIAWICCDGVTPLLDELFDDVMLVVDDVGGIVGAPDDTICWVELAIAGDALCDDWFLLGVEHTVLIGADDVVLFTMDIVSGLLARTAVGFTGYFGREDKRIQW